MTIRAVLRSPFGGTTTRDIVNGRWAEPVGDPDQTVGDGLWALPGLVDAHAHLATAELNYQPGVLEDAQRRAKEALGAGVTLVLDKGWTDRTTMRVIETVPSSERPEIEAAAEGAAREAAAVLEHQQGFVIGGHLLLRSHICGDPVKDPACRAALRAWAQGSLQPLGGGQLPSSFLT